jgi:rubrerythrin
MVTMSEEPENWADLSDERLLDLLRDAQEEAKRREAGRRDWVCTRCGYMMTGAESDRVVEEGCPACGEPGPVIRTRRDRT